MLKPLLSKLFFYSFAVNALILSCASVYSAEEVLLTIEGNLIDRIELVDEGSDADLVITLLLYCSSSGHFESGLHK